DNGGVWRVSWSNGRGCGGEARIRDGVRFGAGGVASVAPGGELRLELRRGGDRTEVEVRAGEDGPRRTMRVNGRAVPWDRAADEWLARAVPVLQRYTRYGRPEKTAEQAEADADAVRSEAEGLVRGAGGRAETVEVIRRAADEAVRSGADTTKSRLLPPLEEPAFPAGPGDGGPTTIMNRRATQQGVECLSTLRARNAYPTADRRGIARLERDGYASISERCGDRQWAVHITPAADGSPRYAWSGEVPDAGREAWLADILGYFGRGLPARW
ncbi:MAG TPA: hypothetical protein VFQ45_18390, partial [Longimicrobium sp.]|nr:hypothetical protein [Longimicrobium sp.]